MIRIDVTRIEEWDYIKRCHNQYFDTYIKASIECYNWKSNMIHRLAKQFIEGMDLEKVATGEVDNFKKYLSEYDKIISTLEKGCTKKVCIKRKKGFNKILISIFNYNKFRDNKNQIEIDGQIVEWNRHRLISLMKIHTCPYCNRQYITNYIQKDEKRTTADLDHFYVQEKHPFLALSLYNFIPSCQICNSRFKGSNFDAAAHIYPYREEFGSEAVFKVNAENMNYVWGKDKPEIKIESNEKGERYEKIINSIETFKLDKVYQVHSDYVSELIKKSIMYDENAVKDIFKQYPGMFNSEEEVWECIMGNYMVIEKLGDRPLAKLTKDICEQYGIQLK